MNQNDKSKTVPDDKSKYDTIFKHLTALFPKAFAEEFYPDYNGEEASIFSESLSISERRLDRAILIEGDSPGLFHMEFEKKLSDMSRRAFRIFCTNNY